MSSSVVVELSDSERLDAIGRYGLCVVRQDTLVSSQWEETWVCSFFVNGAEVLMMGPTLREVLDSTVAHIEQFQPTKH